VFGRESGKGGESVVKGGEWRVESEEWRLGEKRAAGQRDRIARVRVRVRLRVRVAVEEGSTSACASGEL
jgi:hypothetical protein